MTDDPRLDFGSTRAQPLGAPAYRATEVPFYGVPTSALSPPPRRRRTGLIVSLAVGALVIASATIGALILLHQAPQLSPSTLAIRACEQAVKYQLKAPATAQFSDESATADGSQTYDVAGDVDAQNGFGALIRTRWTCTAYGSAANWNGVVKTLSGD